VSADGDTVKTPDQPQPAGRIYTFMADGSNTMPEAAAPPRKRSAQALRLIRRIAAEPLAHFAAAGLVLFAAAAVYQHQTDLHRIVITPAHVAELANEYALQFGDKPDPQTLDALIKRDVHDEILFRQGQALKLGQDDEIVRRRIVQKMQFLMQDLNAPAEPTAAQLQAYYDAHAARYATPTRATFSHIYFSSDKGGDDAAKVRATAVLKTLSSQTTRAPDLGDPFPDLYDFSAYEPEQIYRLFGHTPFAEAVETSPVGHWAGPFKSGYGWHLLYVDARENAARPPLSQVRDAVRTDYLQDAQDGANQAAFDKLAHDYHVVRKDLGSTKAEPIGRMNAGSANTGSGSPTGQASDD
jgi:peptidyl-prolyl cis-trans isomerase C